MEERINGLSMEELEAIVLRAVKRAVTEIAEDLQALSKKPTTHGNETGSKDQEPEDPTH